MPEQVGNWTTVGAIRAAVADLRRHPVTAYLLLGLLPVLWFWLFELVFPHPSGGSYSPQLALVLLGWGSLVHGGQFLVALQVARGGSPRGSDLIRGVRLVVPVAIAELLTHELPKQLASLVRGHSREAGPLLALLALLAVSAMVVILIRCALSIPIIVDTGANAWRALATSWRTTRGYSWRIAQAYLLGLLIGMPTVLVFRSRLVERILAVVGGPIMTLALVHIYLLIGSSRGSITTDVTPSPGPPVAPNDELPVRGSGWARNLRKVGSGDLDDR